MENKELENDFPTGEIYEGYRIPLALRLLWLVFFIWGGTYLIKWLLPDLQNWMAAP